MVYLEMSRSLQLGQNFLTEYNVFRALTDPVLRFSVQLNFLVTKNPRSFISFNSSIIVLLYCLWCHVFYVLKIVLPKNFWCTISSAFKTLSMTILFWNMAAHLFSVFYWFNIAEANTVRMFISSRHTVFFCFHCVRELQYQQLQNWNNVVPWSSTEVHFFLVLMNPMKIYREQLLGFFSMKNLQKKL